MTAQRRRGSGQHRFGEQQRFSGSEGAHLDECDTTNTMTRSKLAGGDHIDDSDTISGGAARLNGGDDDLGLLRAKERAHRTGCDAANSNLCSTTTDAHRWRQNPVKKTSAALGFFLRFQQRRGNLGFAASEKRRQRCERTLWRGCGP